MIAWAGAPRIEAVSRIGRPWHGRIDNQADGATAILTLASGAARPWPGRIETNEAHLLRRPIARARLCLDVHAGAPGTYPPADAPDWPLTSAAEHARGMRYLDYALTPHGTGANPYWVAFAADGTPWILALDADYSQVDDEIVFRIVGAPYGRIGVAPIASLPLTPATPGADRLSASLYGGIPNLYGSNMAAMVEPWAPLSISSDGKRLLYKVTGRDHKAMEPPIGCVVGLIEVELSGGDAAQPPSFTARHRLGWQDARGLEADNSITGLVVHAWYDALDEIELVTLDKHYLAEGGFYGGTTWRLWGGQRQIAEATILYEPYASTLNGEPIPGGTFSGGGGYSGVPDEQHDPADYRLRHHYAAMLTTGTEHYRFVLTPRMQSSTVIGLYAATAVVGSTTVNWSRWIGAGTPDGIDPSTLTTDLGTVAIIPAPQDCQNCLPYPRYTPDHPHGSWHPITHQIIRNHAAHVSFA